MDVLYQVQIKCMHNSICRPDNSIKQHSRTILLLTVFANFSYLITARQSNVRGNKTSLFRLFQCIIIRRPGAQLTALRYQLYGMQAYQTACMEVSQESRVISAGEFDAGPTRRRMKAVLDLINALSGRTTPRLLPRYISIFLAMPRSDS